MKEWASLRVGVASVKFIGAPQEVGNEEFLSLMSSHQVRCAHARDWPCERGWLVSRGFVMAGADDVVSLRHLQDNWSAHPP